MKKILVIHTSYRSKGGEQAAFLNDKLELQKKFVIKSINLNNEIYRPLLDTFNILLNRNKGLIKSLKELETEFSPDYYYFHNTWFKAAGIVSHLLNVTYYKALGEQIDEILKLIDANIVKK